MSNAKEKPAAGTSGSGPSDSDSSVEPSTLTVADAERLTQERDRTPLQRTAALATALARDEGRIGTYVVWGSDVWWLECGDVDCVAYTIDGRHGRELRVPDASEVAHEPFVLAADLTLHEIPVSEPVEVCQ